MKTTFSQRHIHFQEHQNMALFSQAISSFWPYFSKKLIAVSFLIKCLAILKWNYEAIGFIKDTVKFHISNHNIERHKLDG